MENAPVHGIWAADREWEKAAETGLHAPFHPGSNNLSGRAAVFQPASQPASHMMANMTAALQRETYMYKELTMTIHLYSKNSPRP